MLQPHIPARPETMPIREIAGRLTRLMKQNASDADYTPFAAIARHIGVHRDTVYEAAKGVTVNHYTQILLSRFLISLDAGELEARQVESNGRYEIINVENPKPRLRMRVDINLKAGTMQLINSPYQPQPKLPNFASLFCIK